jgi:short subunit dehydrogenase-like uncharacterized protein
MLGWQRSFYGALVHVVQAKELDAAGCLKGGVLTPASAIGMVGIERLRQAGLQFETAPME